MAKQRVTKQKKVVISKIEITKNNNLLEEVKGKTEPSERVEVDARSLSLQKYHSNVNEIGKKIVKFACSLSDNLLSVKMALMQAVGEVEKKIKENKKE